MPLDPVRLPPGDRFPEAARVLACLAHSSKTSSEIARRIGLPIERVWRCLSQLSERGIVALVLDARERPRWNLVSRVAVAP